MKIYSMKKFNKTILTGLSLALVCSGVYFTSSLTSGDDYSPRNKKTDAVNGIDGAMEYALMLKRNQNTGKIDLGDVLAAREALNNQKSFKAGGLPLNWEPTGPDNVGGRTRSILVDRNNPNILYSGGVSGGLFKSINKGASWYTVNDFQENLAVVSLCQTSDGTIYYGTGEGGVNGLFQSDGAEFSSIVGEGIFKSTDGVTFTQLPTSKQFSAVSALAVNPKDNTIYAGTDKGLYYSDDAGATWKKLRDGNTRDVQISSNGTVLAYVASLVWRSENGKDANSYVRSTGLPGSARISVAISPQDPNYVYAFVAGSISIVTATTTINVSSGMVGLYQSTDNGVNFTQVVGKESQFFSILTHTSTGSSQGTYDLICAVHPRDKERVFMGGIGFAEWSPSQGPRVVGNTFHHPSNPFGIHPDKHAITFDTVTSPMIMYIGSDGGVAKTTNAEMTTYTDISKNFVTTQFYGCAAGTNGIVIGGTQDNKSMLIDRKGSTRQSAVDILGGDGFRCEVSKINPNVLFVENQYGGLARSLNGGGGVGEIWDNRISANFVSTQYTNNIFNTPMRLWEEEGEEKAKLFYGLNNAVWMARGIISTGAEIRWFKVATIPGNPHIIEVSKDGNHAFVATLAGRINRVDGIQKANFDTTEIVAYAGISDSLTNVDIRGNLPAGRSITDIEIDDNNPNRVIVTMGNYGNTGYIYITENALDPIPTWRAIQGNLPAFPVYDVEIYEKDPNTLIVGTEFGIWATTNGQAATPTWTEQNNKQFPRVPVYEMRQVTEKAWTGPVLYAATHGRGIFESKNLLTSAPQNSKVTVSTIKTYPNPAKDIATLSFNSTKNGKVNVKVYDIKGNLVEEKSVTISLGQNEVSLDTRNYTNGIYITSIEGTVSGKSKFIVSH
jgi:hypothetical protein